MPWLTKLATAVLRGRLEQEQDGLAREAVRNLERLGPTFLKLGQVLSIRCVECLPAQLSSLTVHTMVSACQQTASNLAALRKAC